MHIKAQVQRNASGFTILELMVATTIFAVILLVLTAGVLSFTRDYFASVTRTKTQTVARAVVDDITRAIQFSGVEPVLDRDANGNIKAICIGNVAYYSATGTELSKINNAAKHQNVYGLVKRLSTSAISCTPPTPNIAGFAFNAATDQEMLARNIRVSDLDIHSIGQGEYVIRLRLAYGDDDLFGITGAPASWADIRCNPNAGSQYCAVSDLTTTAQRRIQ